MLRWYNSKAHFTAAARGELIVSFGTSVTKEEIKGKGMCISIKNENDEPFYAFPESSTALLEWMSLLRLFSGEDFPTRKQYLSAR